jgi:hypothetical protein
MNTTFTDPFDALLSLQRELRSRFASYWLQDATTSSGPFPPINVFQQGDDILALMELPGIDKGDLQVQVQANTVRISGARPCQRLQLQQKRELENKEDSTIPAQLFVPTADIYETNDALDVRAGDAGRKQRRYRGRGRRPQDRGADVRGLASSTLGRAKESISPNIRGCNRSTPSTMWVTIRAAPVFPARSIRTTSQPLRSK